MIIRQLQAFQYQIPLMRSLPVGIQRIDSRRGLVLTIRVEDVDGNTTQFFAEASPLSGEDVNTNPIRGFSLESVEQVVNGLKEIGPKLVGCSPEALADCADEIKTSSLAFGLSVLAAKAQGRLKPTRVQPRSIPLIYQIKGEPLQSFISRIKALPDDIRAVKVKVAQTSIQQELALIYQILAVRPKLTLRLDANRGFALEQAIQFCASLPLDRIEYIEEPCMHPSDNHKLHLATGIRYALDESLNVAHFKLVPRSGLAALVIKPTIMGSLHKLQTLVEQAEQYGIRCILSSSLEANVGIQDIIDIAAIVTPEEPPGVDTLGAFGDDLLYSTGKTNCLKLDQLTPACSFTFSESLQD